MLHLLNAPPDFEAADEALQKALDLAESLADPHGTAMVGWMIGRAHIMRGDLPKAIETLEACIANGQSIGDRMLVGSLHNARGWAAFLAGDMNRAEESVREHLLIAPPSAMSRESDTPWRASSPQLLHMATSNGPGIARDGRRHPPA